MDPRLFILTQIHDACRQMDLNDDYGSPSWSDGQFFRACILRLKRDDVSAWQEFLQRISADCDLASSVREMLLDVSILFEVPATKDGEFGDVEFGLPWNDVELSLPSDTEAVEAEDKNEFLRLLNVWDRDQVVSRRPCWPPRPRDLDREFTPPSKESPGEIMYIEMKPGLSGPARIGRVRFSKTRKTLYYGGKKLQSLKGGYKANYYDVESGMEYWVSRCKKNGTDTLYPGVIEIDDDAREEYWTEIRKQPENKHLTKFRSPGKHSKRQPS